MNYEELYSEYLSKEKEMRDCIAEQQKCFKRLIKEMDNGDIKNALKDMNSLSEISRSLGQTSEAMLYLAQGFDINLYLASGEFAEQMLACCEKSGVDAIGENNNYELFPYRVKLDGENADITLDRKKAPYFRPQSLVKFIKAQIDKMMSAPFNPSAFANELAAAYDLSLVVQSAEKGRKAAKEGDVYLSVLYKYLTPMKRFRKDYDMQSFAFDIARLFTSDVKIIDDGRELQFGPTRKNEKAIRVLDKNSQEWFLVTVRFFVPDGPGT